MKLKITKPDGTVIEAEGTAEECAALVHRDVKPENVPQSAFIPTVVTPPLTWPETLPQPWWGVEPDRYWRPYEVTCGGIATTSLTLSSEVQ